MSLHIELALIAFLGMLISVLMKYKSLYTKAEAANVSLPFGTYLKQDWIALTISIATIIMALLMLDNIVNLHVNAMNWVKFVFSFVGYASNDLILRLGSAANKKLNNIINAETGIRAVKINIEEGAEPPKR